VKLKDMMNVAVSEEGPGTPPPAEEALQSRTTPSPVAEGSVKDTEETPGKSRGKKRHRRAKGKKKKQKTSLLITNEDGTNSTADAAASGQKKKVFIRPSNNPLLRAPKNSTQFIIDDHENSNLFWNFDSNRGHDTSKEDIESVGEESSDVQLEFGGSCFDDDSYWDKDFESVYETAHQEEIYSWNRTRIIEEISTLEKRQKQLIDMLSQIDPMIYLQKLQHELLSLQEQNRQLKLINIAEKLERENRNRKGSRTSSPRLPDSTTEVDGEESKDAMENTDDSDDSSSSSSSSSEDSDPDDDGGGGCSSGCCLAQSCRDEVMERLREVAEDGGDDGEQEITTGASHTFNDAVAVEREDQSANENTLNVDDTSHTNDDDDDKN